MGQHEGGGVRLLRLIAVAAMTLMVDSSPAPAQQAGTGATEELDAGRFEILVDGRPVGTEVFAIRRVGTKVRSVGRLQVENGEEAWWPFEVRMQTNADLEPEIYELKFMAGPIQTVVGRRTENGLLIHTATDEGERYKEFGTEAGTIILEHGAPLRTHVPAAEGRRGRRAEWHGRGHRTEPERRDHGPGGQDRRVYADHSRPGRPGDEIRRAAGQRTTGQPTSGSVGWPRGPGPQGLDTRHWVGSYPNGGRVRWGVI